MKQKPHFIVILSILFLQFAIAQNPQESIDLAAIEKIKEEGINNSQLMESLFYLTDIHGPRLTGSPGYKQAAEWARDKLYEWGINNAHIEGASLFGRGWSLNRFSAQVIEPKVFPLIAYARAWSPGTGGVVSGDAVFLDEKKDSTLESYRGKLKGKLVLFRDQKSLKPHFEPTASRFSDSTLATLANFQPPDPEKHVIEYDPLTQWFLFLSPGEVGQRRFEYSLALKKDLESTYQKMILCQQEGAAAILFRSHYDGGKTYVAAAEVPTHPDTPLVGRFSSWDPKAPKLIPQLYVSAEHYNRIVRLLQNGTNVKVELNLDVEFFVEDSVYNIIAEIPGTDLKDEVVMIGGHFDSVDGGTGATDNGAGVAVCMEALRILKALELNPRRTIRIGLWGGEEQGALGSRAYVKKYLGGTGTFYRTGRTFSLKPAAEKFSVYFNLDLGTGKIRGICLMDNESVLPIFRAWLKPFKDWDGTSLINCYYGNSDHVPFDAIGLPAFQFIQDPIEYSAHSTMDVYDRILEEDLKQAAVIMATFAYSAAMRDELLPRRTLSIEPSRK